MGVHCLDVEEDGLDLTAWFQGKKGHDCSLGGLWGGIAPILERDTGGMVFSWGKLCSFLAGTLLEQSSFAGEELSLF